MDVFSGLFFFRFRCRFFVGIRDRTRHARSLPTPLAPESFTHLGHELSPFLLRHILPSRPHALELLSHSRSFLFGEFAKSAPVSLPPGIKLLPHLSSEPFFFFFRHIPHLLYRPGSLFSQSSPFVGRETAAPAAATGPGHWHIRPGSHGGIGSCRGHGLGTLEPGLANVKADSPSSSQHRQSDDYRYYRSPPFHVDSLPLKHVTAFPGRTLGHHLAPPGRQSLPGRRIVHASLP